MLHSKGGVWVNGSESPESTAIFPGASLETKSGSVANLDADGSSVLIQPESLLTFNGDSLTLEHGSVMVTTSKSMSVFVKCIKVVPVLHAWTQYEVTDLNGTVRVAAVKSDVNVSQGVGTRKPSPESASQSGTVREGQQAERNESEACGAAEQPKVPGHALDTKWVEIGGAAAGGGLILCLLLCKGTNPPRVSPSQP
ncbi:MAG: hypothetical protein WCA16_17985 [Candidatus Sulfotelmatobacter sp.]